MNIIYTSLCGVTCYSLRKTKSHIIIDYFKINAVENFSLMLLKRTLKALKLYSSYCQYSFYVNIRRRRHLNASNLFSYAD
jgi:hypothetical protein